MPNFSATPLAIVERLLVHATKYVSRAMGVKII
jgi:hypothetical protein